MYFSSLSDFIHMGGYAFYVWLAYGITFGGMILIVFSEYMAGKKIIREIKNKKERERRIKAGQNMENTL